MKKGFDEVREEMFKKFFEHNKNLLECMKEFPESERYERIIKFCYMFGICDGLIADHFGGIENARPCSC